MFCAFVTNKQPGHIFLGTYSSRLFAVAPCFTCDFDLLFEHFPRLPFRLVIVDVNFAATLRSFTEVLRLNMG